MGTYLQNLVLNLKQGAKNRKTQNQHFFPTFSSKFCWFSLALKTPAPTDELVLSALHHMQVEFGDG
jgi:hypothetical protein